MSTNAEILNGYTCPVCGFTMPAPPSDFNICPSCGTEFGNDDTDWTFEQLRQAWLEKGAHWWSNTQVPPPNWSPVEQVLHVIQIVGVSRLEENTVLDHDEYFEISPGAWTSWWTTGNAVAPCRV